MSVAKSAAMVIAALVLVPLSAAAAKHRRAPKKAAPIATPHRQESSASPASQPSSATTSLPRSEVKAPRLAATATRVEQRLDPEPVQRGAAETNFEIAADAVALRREFNVTQNLFGELIRQSQPLIFMFGGHATYYPLAPVLQSMKARVALTGHFLYGLPSQAHRDDATIKMSAWQASGALRGDLRLGPTQLSLLAGAGADAMQFAATQMNGLLPSALYIYLRTGIAIQIELGSHAVISAAGGFRYVLSSGALSVALPRSTVLAVDAELRFSVPIAAGFEVSAFANYARYFARSNARPGDQFVVGGFSDDRPGGGISAQFSH